ncbi:MAG: DnaJ domain-containing protein [Thermodesulfobacteria bacterium]|nr:DnaJ domain-containing protein [Thermodesulfobacteriota bacterium]
MELDPYKILGLNRDASLEEVKSAYRRLVRILHPDVCGRNMKNIKRFLAVKDAYLVLKKRLEAKTAHKVTHRVDRVDPVSAGDDHSIEGTYLFVQLELRDALYGKTVPLEVAAGQDFCSKCKGIGKVADETIPPCPICRGKGYRSVTWGDNILKVVCSQCSGRGKAKMKSCPECSGKGIVTRNKTIEIKIPAGVRDGTVLGIDQISLEKPGQNCPVNLYIEVEVNMPEGWIIHGKDIIASQDIDCWTKLGGGYIDVDTVDGKQRVFVNPGLGQEKFIRIKNKGWIDEHGRRGDHIVRLNVLSPAGPCPKEAMELINALKRLWPCNGQGPPALPCTDNVHSEDKKNS